MHRDRLVEAVHMVLSKVLAWQELQLGTKRSVRREAVRHVTTACNQTPVTCSSVRVPSSNAHVASVVCLNFLWLYMIPQ